MTLGFNLPVPRRAAAVRVDHSKLSDDEDMDAEDMSSFDDRFSASPSKLLSHLRRVEFFDIFPI